jgi:hypothetical protein
MPDSITHPQRFGYRDGGSEPDTREQSSGPEALRPRPEYPLKPLPREVGSSASYYIEDFGWVFLPQDRSFVVRKIGIPGSDSFCLCYKLSVAPHQAVPGASNFVEPDGLSSCHLLIVIYFKSHIHRAGVAQDIRSTSVQCKVIWVGRAGSKQEGEVSLYALLKLSWKVLKLPPRSIWREDSALSFASSMQHCGKSVDACAKLAARVFPSGGHLLQMDSLGWK